MEPEVIEGLDGKPYIVDTENVDPNGEPLVIPVEVEEE